MFLAWLSRKELKQTFLQESDKITVKVEAARSFEWLPLLCLLSLYLILFQWCALFAMNGFFYFAKGPEWVLGKNIHPTRCRKVEEIFFTSSALRVDICQKQRRGKLIAMSLFWSEEKQWKWHFLTLKTGSSGAQNENLRPVLKSGLWHGKLVSNLLTFGHWEVVFSLFLILYRAFPHFMYLRKFKFHKRQRTSPQNV